jgi:hypothetical protein
MGYRSNVMALIYPDVDQQDAGQPQYEQLKVLMATTFKAVSDEFESYVTWMDDDRVLKFDMEDVKWYPSYADVKMFIDMMDMLNGNDEEGIPGYCTEFVRIGEDSDDVEEQHSGDDNQWYLSVRRTIDCNI